VVLWSDMAPPAARGAPHAIVELRLGDRPAVALAFGARRRLGVLNAFEVRTEALDASHERGFALGRAVAHVPARFTVHEHGRLVVPVAPARAGGELLAHNAEAPGLSAYRGGTWVGWGSAPAVPGALALTPGLLALSIFLAGGRACRVLAKEAARLCRRFAAAPASARASFVREVASVTIVQFDSQVLCHSKFGAVFELAAC
jgi:hypothetical protein